MVTAVLWLGQVGQEQGAVKGEKEARVSGFLGEFKRGKGNSGSAEKTL